jgi:hypothetical protein
MIDKSVYENNGLRMIGSHKGKASSTSGIYWPTLEMNDDEVTPLKHDEVMRELPSWVRSTSIRLPPGALVPEVEMPPRRKLYVDFPGHDDADATPVDSDTAQAVEMALEKTLPRVYKSSKMTVTKTLAKKKAWLVRSSSKFCHNINSDHRSTNVFFYVTAEHAVQKCFCTCDTTKGRLYGQCRKFSSKPFKFSKPVVTQLRSLWV